MTYPTAANLHRVMSSTPAPAKGTKQNKKGTGSGPNAGCIQGDYMGSKDGYQYHNSCERLKGKIITPAEQDEVIKQINQIATTPEHLFKLMSILEEKKEVEPLTGFDSEVEKALNELCQEQKGLFTYGMIAVKLGRTSKSALAVAKSMTRIWHHYYIIPEANKN